MKVGTKVPIFFVVRVKTLPGHNQPGKLKYRDSSELVVKKV